MNIGHQLDTVGGLAGDDCDSSQCVARLDEDAPGKAACPQRMAAGADSPKPRVLLATRDERLLAAGPEKLTSCGYAVAVAADGIGCVRLLRECTFDTVVLDDDLLWGGADGVIEYFRGGQTAPVPVVVLTSQPNGASEGTILFADPIVATLNKPFPMDLLLTAPPAATSARERAGRGV